MTAPTLARALRRKTPQGIQADNRSFITEGYLEPHRVAHQGVNETGSAPDRHNQATCSSVS